MDVYFAQFYALFSSESVVFPFFWSSSSLYCLLFVLRACSQCHHSALSMFCAKSTTEREKKERNMEMVFFRLLFRAGIRNGRETNEGRYICIWKSPRCQEQELHFLKNAKRYSRDPRLDITVFTAATYFPSSVSACKFSSIFLLFALHCVWFCKHVKKSQNRRKWNEKETKKEF